MEWSLGQRGWSSLRERAVVDHCFVKMQLEWAHAGRERMWVTHRKAGGLTINRAWGDAARLHRTKRLLEQDESPVMFLNLVLGGNGQIEQAGRVQRADAGQLMLFDGMQPFVIEGSGLDPHMLIVRVPYEELGGAVGPLRELCAAHLCSDARWLHDSIVGLLSPFWARRSEIDEPSGGAVTQAVVTLLRAVPHVGAEFTASQEGDVRRLRRCIEERYANANLAPEDIARAIGLSLRRLHLLCAALRRTCMELVYAYRLERARELLLAQSGSRQSMLDIAQMCGFSSAAHFSRRFTQRFGYPPSSLK